MSPVQAVVMAGGEGSRLRPLTSNLPKPMLPVANRPLMEHILELLRRNGITDVVATVQFLSSVIRNYFDDGSDMGVSLSYATEDVPLGTAGSVLGARDLLDGRFVVVSGDALTDLDLGQVLAWHEQREAAATLVLKRMQDPLEFGIVMTAADGRIERFLEKPSWGQVFTDTVNTGIYVLEPEVLDLIPGDRPYDFSSELFPRMLSDGLPIFGFVTDAYWTDVGNSEAYLQAQLDAVEGRVDIEVPGFELQPRVWVGEDVDIDDSAVITGPAVLGDNCRVGPNARVEAGAVVGDHAIVGADASVTGGVLMDAAHVGPGAVVRGAVLGRGASLDRGSTVEEGTVLGDDVVVGSGALIRPRVKIYPSRTVEAGAIVAESLVRERKASRSLFGARGVSGLVNIGMTPQVAVRLGMAYGTALPRYSTVVLGRDASRAARTIKRALIAGLTSTGVNCHDLELMALPVTRFTVRSEQAAGGVSVRTSTQDSEVVQIRLFDAEGADLSEADQRKIDRAYMREDFRRPGAHHLGELEFPAHALGGYATGLLRSVDLDPIRGSRLKVVIDYAHGAASLVGASILGRLGVEALSVNAFTDEHRPVLGSTEIDALIGNVCEHVRKSGSDLGVVLEPGGEVAHLIDDQGEPVAREQALRAFLGHEAQRGARTLAVPVSTSTEAERIAGDAGVPLRWTPTGLPALMAEAQRGEVDFVGDAEGTLIWPQFMPAPDAMLTFCKALELRVTTGKPLSDLLGAQPESHLVRRTVRTPWRQKGAVMREVAAAAQESRLVLLDGVKIVEDDRWVLVIPSPDEPRCTIWAEASSGEEARALAEDYAALVERVVARAVDESA
ncbi:MAG: sugar phosphate nucleotidyltransferase [Actinomycetota bacterium]